MNSETYTDRFLYAIAMKRPYPSVYDTGATEETTITIEPQQNQKPKLSTGAAGFIVFGLVVVSAFGGAYWQKNFNR